MAPSAEFRTEMNRKTGSMPLDKVQIVLDAGTIDITAYYLGGADFDKEKGGEVAKLNSGDMILTFSNYNNYFNKLDPTSLFYGVNYMNRKIIYSVGFRLPDGTTEYLACFTGQIQRVEVSQDESKAYITIRDLITKVLGERLNTYPAGMIPAANGGNTGNGMLDQIATKPFATVSETITVTFSSASAFAVAGSTSGALGSGTVGTLFTATGNKVRFMITAGTVAFISGDIITFNTYQYPEFTDVNPAKIVWALLTGHNYDTGAAEDWHDRSLQLDDTQSAANTDLDYASFQTAVSNISFTLTGYVGYNQGAAETIEEIITLCLGSLFVDGDGKIEINVYAPSIGTTLTEFADTKKIMKCKTGDDITEMINYASGNYKAVSGDWAWSDETEVLGGKYTKSNTGSITDNKKKNTLSFDTAWYSPDAAHIQYLFDRVVDRKGLVPFIAEIETGLDALEIKLVDRIQITETKSSLAQYVFEVLQLRFNFTDRPKKVFIRGSLESFSVLNWGYCGSEIDEGDGISPQNADFAAASAEEKQFAYAGSETPGETDCAYYCW